MEKTILMVQHANNQAQINPMACPHTNTVPTYGLVATNRDGIPILEHHTICLDCLLIDPPVFHESTIQPSPVKNLIEPLPGDY